MQAVEDLLKNEYRWQGTPSRCYEGSIGQCCLAILTLHVLPRCYIPAEMSAADMMAMSEADDFKERARELSFASSLGALSIVR